MAQAFSTEKELYSPWIATWPSFEEVMSSMPLAWTSMKQAHLPPAALVLLEKQKKKFKKDWDGVRTHTKNMRDKKSTREEYMYYWLLANSRCYYWPFAKSYKPKGKSKSLSLDDSMAMLPWADYFNHGSQPAVCPLLLHVLQ
jgi:hypothetical protein